MIPRQRYLNEILKGSIKLNAVLQIIRNKSEKKSDQNLNSGKWDITKKANVTILGAGGGVGQAISLLLKINPMVGSLKLYDISLVKGLSLDLSHINTPVRVKSYMGSTELADSLHDTDIVLVCAGLSRKLGMSRNDLFATNATIVRDMVEASSMSSPRALIAIMTNPLNSMVPVACNALQKLGRFDARKVFGVTTVDIIRAITFLAEAKNFDPRALNVPVIGGHSGTASVPVFSRSSPRFSLTKLETELLTRKVQEAGDTVLEFKAGSGTSTAGSAFGLARFVTSLCRGLNGERGIVECAYVKSQVTDVGYCSTELELGKEGIERNLGIGKLNEYETKLLEASNVQLKNMVARGEQFGEPRMWN